MSIKAVIFDFDGVLADTISVSAKELREILSKRGVKFKDIDLFLLEGEGIKEIIAELLGKDVNSQEVQEVYEQKIAMARKDCALLKPWPEPLKIAKKLKREGLRIGLASGSNKEFVVSILGDELKIFDVVLTREDTKKAKPNPEPYIKTAQKLGVKPNECIAIDNAPRGIESAKRAGMKCIAITTTLSSRYLDEADVTVRNFEELEKAINRIRESAK